MALIVQVMMIVIHVAGCYVFLKHFNLGIQGLGYANTVSCGTTYLIYLVYTSCLKGEIADAVQWPNSKSFKYLGVFLQKGIPATLMLALEWWAFEVMTLMAGVLGVTDQAAQIVIINISALMFMLALGAQQSAVATIGPEIGRFRIDLAKKY